MGDGDMQKAVNGDFTGDQQKVVSCAMAVPVVTVAYSTLLILLGHCIFVITINDANADFTSPMDNTSGPGFKIVAGVPIIGGICMMVGAVVIAELMYHRCCTGGKTSADIDIV